jgi:hypothetical protein
MNTVTLPASRLEIPESDYSISGLKTLAGRETRVVEAKLRRGKTVIADIQNDGNGGQTFARFISREESAAFHAWVDSWTIRIESEYFPEGHAYDAGSVLDALVDEVLLAKDLKRKAKTKFLFLEEGEDPMTEYHLLINITFENPRLPERIAEYAPGAVLYWNNEGWVPVPK